jgi:hypothetical protein
MWKSDKNETFEVLFILFDVVIFVVVINSFRRCDNLLFDVVIIRFSTFWSTKKTISTFWLSTEFSEFFLVFDVVIFVVLTFSLDIDWHLVIQIHFITKKFYVKIIFFWTGDFLFFYVSFANDYLFTKNAFALERMLNLWICWISFVVQLKKGHLAKFIFRKLNIPKGYH